MLNIKQSLQTKNISKGKNTCEYIVLHHTWSWEGTIKWVLNQLTVWPVSCHFVCDINGDIYRIGQLKDILWHAGISSWRGRKDMNRYSIGIEIIWPLPWFTNAQRKSVRELCSFLVGSLGIPVENIIRHKDIAPGRKTDIDDSFWNNEYTTFTNYQNSYMTTPNNEQVIVPSQFLQIFEEERKKYRLEKKEPYRQRFSDLSGDRPATIADVKLLIEIAQMRA